MKEFSGQIRYENVRLPEIQAALFHLRSLPTVPPLLSALYELELKGLMSVTKNFDKSKTENTKNSG